MQTALRTNASAEPEEPSSTTPDFDYQASRDLEQIDLADGYLRKAWRALTPPARRSAVATGCILELAAMLADLHSERKRLEEEAGL